MKINVLVGTLESKSEIIFQQLINKDFLIGRKIINFAGLDGIGGVKSINYNLCKKQFNFCLEQLSDLKKENFFFSGLGCALFAEQLITDYPNFNYYFFKNKNTQLKKSTIQKILDTTETSEEWVIETEFKILNIFENLTNKLNLNWVPCQESIFYKNFQPDPIDSSLLISDIQLNKNE
jgi:hypothetical protein